MIPIEVEEVSLHVMFRPTFHHALREESGLSNEARKMAHLREKALKHRISQRYNAKVIPRTFNEGELVLRRADIGKPPVGHGKLAAN